jgi:DNA-directed RNA polymerase III subunit RPC11
MIFCPLCANVLLLKKSNVSGSEQFYCQTCPYVYSIQRPMANRLVLGNRKTVDDILGGAEAWKNVDSTEGNVSFIMYIGYIMNIM